MKLKQWFFGRQKKQNKTCRQVGEVGFFRIKNWKYSSECCCCCCKTRQYTKYSELPQKIVHAIFFSVLRSYIPLFPITSCNSYVSIDTMAFKLNKWCPYCTRILLQTKEECAMKSDCNCNVNQSNTSELRRKRRIKSCNLKWPRILYPGVIKICFKASKPDIKQYKLNEINLVLRIYVLRAFYAERYEHQWFLIWLRGWNLHISIASTKCISVFAGWICFIALYVEIECKHRRFHENCRLI